MTTKNYNQEIFNFEVDISSKEEDFLIADSNLEAVRWVDNWKSWSAPSIVIYGPRGCGKTHLSNIFIQKSGAKKIVPEALSNNSPQSFLEKSNIFVLEYVENNLDQEALLHFYNNTIDSGGQILFTARSAPSHWGLSLRDLESRLRALPSISIGMPEDALLERVLVKHFSDRQLLITSDVVGYLITRIERSLEAASNIVSKIDGLAISSGRPITLPLVREALAIDKLKN